jgi:hypothetical protein
MTNPTLEQVFWAAIQVIADDVRLGFTTLAQARGLVYLAIYAYYHPTPP